MESPLIFYSIFLFLGQFLAYFILENVYISIVFMVILFFIIFKEIKKIYMFFLICFFILGFFSYVSFFSFKLDYNPSFRIIENKKYEVIAVNSRRKFILEGNFKNVNKGDILICSGKFEKNPNYKKGVLGTYKVKSFKIKKDFISYIEEKKRRIYKIFEKYQGKENSGVIMAVSLGDKQYLSYNKKNNISDLGISHIITLSGFHIALIYSLLEKILGYKSSLFITFLYVVIVGFSASTLRAFIMITLIVISKKIYREYDGVTALSTAFFIILLIKPYYILDVGFNLSFLATLGILTTNKNINLKLNILPKILRDTVALTLSAMIFTTPYLLFNFGTLNINGIITNLLIIPFYSFLIIISNIAILTVYFKSIFIILNYIISGIFLVINTMENFFIQNSFYIFNEGYMMALTFISIYYAYILYKRGHKLVIHVPLFMFIISTISFYKFYPNINYIKSNKGTMFTVSYGKNNIIFSDKIVKLSKIKDNVNADDIYDEIKAPLKIKIKDKYVLNVIPKGKNLDLEIYDKRNKGKIILSKDKAFYSINKYDKIKIIKDDENIINGKIYAKFKIINNKVIQYYY